MTRHAVWTRLWHWLNLACAAIMLASGLTISNAHPRLYWGEAGFARAEAWLEVPRWPAWLTLPAHYDLAAARDWHLLFAWPFAAGLALMWLAMVVSGHFRRDLATRRAEWRPRAVWADVRAHLRLDFDHGGGKFNFLQKLAYGAVLGVVLPGMIATGMAISPGLAPALAPLLDVVGGRQSARSLHAILAASLVAFTVLHVALVLLSGPRRQLRAMTIGARADAA